METRAPLYFTCLENEKNYPCSAGIYSLICLREEGTESLAGGGGGARSNWSLYFILLGVIQKDGHWSIGLIRDDQIQGLGVFLSHSNQVKTNNRSNILDRFHFYTKKAHVLCWRQKPSFIGETNQVVNRPSQRRHTSDWYCIDIFLRLLWKYLSQDL